MKWFGVIQKKTTQLLVHGGSAAVNRGADFVQHLVQSPLAPEQGTGPVTAHRSIKLSFA